MNIPTLADAVLRSLVSERMYCRVRHQMRRQHYQAVRAQDKVVGTPPLSEVLSLRPFDEYRCIFIHVPKTAGISVAKALFGNAGPGHLSAAELCLIFGPDFWRYFRFTFVRNPFTRLVSAYEYLNRGGHAAWRQDRAFRDNVLSGYKDFRAFVLGWLSPDRPATETYFHFRPQHSYLEIDAKLAVDFVGRVEDIDRDFGEICERLGVRRTLNVHNRTLAPRRTMTDYYGDDAVVERVRAAYARDFELLGYSRDVPSA